MKSTLMAMGLALFALTAAAGPSVAAEAKQDFTLVNKTGYDIDQVFVSPTKSGDWEEDVLGKDVLEDGDAWEIKFHRAAKTCKWDLKVVYSDDDSSAVWYGIDLCSIEKITIRYDRKTDKTSAKFD